MAAKARGAFQMGSTINKTINQPTRLEEDADNFYWVIDHCVCMYRPKHDAACCFVTVGGLVESMKWLTEKQYTVQEVACLNNGGSTCRFRIPKTPTE